ncbi:MAG: transketolase [Planctomycetes bacterium]|nr:transketolase [Planctomycetota bacterium]
MAVELAAAASIKPEDRHRKGLAYPNPLAGNPQKGPAWAAAVTRADGSTLQVADPVATRTMVSLMDMNAVIGGAACHFGGPAALAELMSSIHGVMFARPGVWHQHFNFVNDAGHTENGVYALKANYGFAGLTVQDLKAFRSIRSKLTGHGESHLFPEGVMVSNGPLGSSIPVAQGLALADRLADNRRTTICVISDGAMMEGEAKESVAAIPGFAAKGLCNPFVLVVSDNNTKLSGRIDADAFSMHPYFSSLAAQGWNVIRCEKGNDLQAAFTAVESAIAAAEADPTRPVALWATTVKGFGVAATMKSASGGHGFPLTKAADLRPFVAEVNSGKPFNDVFENWLKEIEDQAKAQVAKDAEKAKTIDPQTKASPAPAPVKKDKIQAGFPKAMIAAADQGLPVVSISADLQGSTGVAPFRAKFPQLSYEVGVAESNMVSTAAGFSKLGYIPVVDTFAQFGVTKGLLPICMANLSQSAVIGVFSHTGFQDAADGASHQALQYLAMTGAIPHLQQYCPASAEEAEWAMAFAIQRFADERKSGKHPDTVLLFVGRENFPVSLKAEGASYAWGSAMIVADTTKDKKSSVAISANGSMVVHAIKAADALAKDGIGALVLNNATPNRPDLKGHQAAIARCGGKLVSVEDHQAIGGAGAMLVSALVAADTQMKAKVLGVHGEFGQSAYLAEELYKKHGIDAGGIAAAAKALG